MIKYNGRNINPKNINMRNDVTMWYVVAATHPHHERVVMIYPDGKAEYMTLTTPETPDDIFIESFLSQKTPKNTLKEFMKRAKEVLYLGVV